APSDAIADFELVAAHVTVDTCPDLLDDTYDLVSEYAGAWVGSAALVGVDVGAADRRHRHPHQHFAWLRGPHGIFLEDEWRVRRLVFAGLGSTLRNDTPCPRSLDPPQKRLRHTIQRKVEDVVVVQR